MPGPDRDLYQLLGVCPDASTLEIRRAYRRLARQHHPDHNRAPDSPARFRALTDAYTTLTDPGRRARYDHTISRARPEPASRPKAPPGSRRATLELSTREARLAATGPLTFSTRDGLVIALPAGTRDGDQVLVNTAGRVIALTIWVNPKIP